MENKKPTELKFKFKNNEVTKPTQKTLDECKNWEYMIAYDKITGKRVYK